ncbi:PREDICTED: inner centromere protein A-like [Polistes dominula]|uniref:Inner centromere protein A-like n=1 Tax=Polistes dominula TaxID=743375 RepID=A0ABM1I1P4_POLDO|nr:PREDICTED: inner centromere protein A-like [Polistes dominula]
MIKIISQEYHERTRSFVKSTVIHKILCYLVESIVSVRQSSYKFHFLRSTSNKLAASVVANQQVVDANLSIQELSSIKNIDNNSEHLNITDKYRDKRALGLILSGLAQIFGYNVAPIQLSSLPNPTGTDNNAGASGNNQSPSMQPPMQPLMQQPMQPPMQSPMQPQMQPSMQPPMQQTSSSQMMPMMSTTPAQPRQRETIRFTGVVNFGNRSDVIGHLQQYERMFHGGQTAASSSPSPSPPPPPQPSSMASLVSTTPASFSTMSSFDIRDSLKYRPPLLTPFLVKIPLPIAPNLPPPISSTMINNTPNKMNIINVPRKKEQEIVYRKNENIENYSVENKEIQNEKDVARPESKFQHNIYIDEPYWKKLHEARIAQLERQQEEYAERLKERDRERNHSYQRENNSKQEEIKSQKEEEEEDEEEEKQQNHNYQEEDHSEQEEQSKNREKEEEEEEEEHPENIKEEKYESNDEESESSGERYEEHPGYPRGGPANGKQRLQNTGNYKDYENDSYRNYEREENIKEPLPISDYYEQDKPPQQLRDSYGEILDNRALVDERIANYFDKNKNEQNNDENSDKNSEMVNESEEKSVERYELIKLERNNEDPYKRIREEYAVAPLENKYEEFNLETTDKSELENFDDFAIVKHTPYILPIRYVNGPDEIEEARARRFHSEKIKKANHTRNIINEKRLPRKKPKIEDLTPKIGLPERLIAKKLHEGETKEVQIWPAPFDFIFDNTKKTNVIVPIQTRDRLKENLYRSTVTPPIRRTIVYQENINNLGYFTTPVPTHYEIYQQSVLP